MITNNIINLDENVLNALDFFSKNKPPKLDLSQYAMPFVVGSEGAFFTAKALFAKRASIPANESTFKSIIKSYAPAIKKGLTRQAIVISASGEKDAMWEIELAKQHGLETALLTCNAYSSGAKLADKVIVYKKIAEPYTYNFSTYVGMMLSVTGEDSNIIKNFIQNIKIPENYADYVSYAFILPDQYIDICNMVVTKGEEMFGPHLVLRSFTSGRSRHAKFVVRWDKELVISIGEKNEYFGNPNHRWNIELPEAANMGLILALSYYLVGKIQASKPQYFKENIRNYVRDYGPKAYGSTKPFDLIVPGSES